MLMKKTLQEILKISGIPVVLASLCCLSPVILVLFGISSVSFASSLSDTLYGGYKWVFRGIGLVALLGSLAYYWYKQKGVCTLDAAKRRRNEIVNSIVLALVTGVFGYLFFLYVVVHYLGVWLTLWK
jgi:predicted exporter